jgi:hypothetical protein
LSSFGKLFDQKNSTDPPPISPSVCDIQHMVLIISRTQPLNTCQIKHKLCIVRDNLNLLVSGWITSSHFVLVSPMETPVSLKLFSEKSLKGHTKRNRRAFCCKIPFIERIFRGQIWIFLCVDVTFMATTIDMSQVMPNSLCNACHFGCITKWKSNRLLSALC